MVSVEWRMLKNWGRIGMPKTDTLLNVGDKAPAFNLNTANGEATSLAKILKKGRAFLLFFRGTWWPNCRNQLLSLSKEYDAFKKTGTQLIGIFCQKAENVKAWADENQIPIPLLIDADRSVAKEYGVYVRLSYDAFNIARPANFLVDEKGIIKYVYVSSNQWDRAATDELLAQAKK